jgi:hypothetical protein
MAHIDTYPYTFANGEVADATQINANFDAIKTQLDGNLDVTNLANAAVELAKLHSSVKVIENIYYDYDDDFLPTDHATEDVLTRTFTLSSARYCLILAKGHFQGLDSSLAGGTLYLYDTDTKLDESAASQNGIVCNQTIPALYYGQLSSGSHTIKTKAYTAASVSAGWQYVKQVVIVLAF